MSDAMNTRRATASCLALTWALLGAGAACAQGAATNNPYDGAWSGTLACEDTRVDGTLAKGYTWEFPVVIRDGVLDAQYGERDANSSAHFSGRIQPDGRASLKADGRTGQPDHTVGHVMPGSRFRFTMQGRFEGDRGSAERVELRPCRASFVRQR